MKESKRSVAWKNVRAKTGSSKVRTVDPGAEKQLEVKYPQIVQRQRKTICFQEDFLFVVIEIQTFLFCWSGKGFSENLVGTLMRTSVPADRQHYEEHVIIIPNKFEIELYSWASREVFGLGRFGALEVFSWNRTSSSRIVIVQFKYGGNDFGYRLHLKKLGVKKSVNRTY